MGEWQVAHGCRTLLARFSRYLRYMPLPYNATSLIRTDGIKIIEVLTDKGLEVPVPTCPGWNGGDLGWHVGQVWNFWGRVVSGGFTEADQISAMDTPTRPSDSDLLDWIAVSHNALYSALVRNRPEREVWTWTGANRDVAWVRRRMTQETAVHRWDAANAVGLPYKVPSAVAADGIDEFLMWFAGKGSDASTPPVGGTVHLHCTDNASDLAGTSTGKSAATGEWLVTDLSSSGAEFTREHAKGDAAVRGRARDLLMWIWGREAGPVEVLGDEGVAERFRSFTNM